MNPLQQLSLFEVTKKRGGEFLPLALPEALTAEASLTTAVGAFHAYMRRQGFSENTIKAFGGDLNIFRNYLGPAQPVGAVTAQDLNRFLNYLRFERGVPCNMKSYQRRLTSLKVFFAFLFANQIIAHDPAAAIPHQPVITPLPEILFDDQVEQLLATTRSLMEQPRGDARPHLLLTLILTTGMKKSECMALRLTDLDLTHLDQPMVYIRYEDPRRQHKERKLCLPLDFPTTFQQFREHYEPQAHLFECTSRNLEYILSDVARLAGLDGKVSFEVLRWSSAVRDLKRGMREETLRQKLGLSTITWQEAGDKIKRLAAKPL